MDGKGALRPVLGIKGFIEQKKEDTETLTNDEKVLAQGAGNSFWKTLKKHFDNSIQQLEQINEQAIAQGMTLEEIGRNALVISQVKGVLRKIENVVEDAKEAMENGTGGK